MLAFAAGWPSQDRRDMDWYIGVDVGGTKIRQGVISSGGEVAQCWTSRTPTEEDPSETVGRLVAEWCDRSVPPVRGIGVAIAGMVSRRGHVLAAPHLPAWVGTDIPALFGRQQPDIPVRVIFDGSAGMLGEAWQRRPRLRDAFMLTIGTGVGGGLLIDGTLMRGAHGLSGMPSGLTTADQPGLEAVASGPSVTAAVGASSGIEAVARRSASQPAAVRAFAEASDALYRAIAAVTAITDVTTVLVTGGFGVGAFQFLFPSPVLPARYSSFPLIHSDVTIGVAHTRGNASLLGAVRNLMESDPWPLVP
jgi:glucokinase